MAGITTILAELDKCNLAFQPRRPQPEIEALAAIWARDLPPELTDGQFARAMSEVRRRSRFWPTLADVLQAHAQRPRPEPLALPQPPRERVSLGDFLKRHPEHRATAARINPRLLAAIDLDDCPL